MRAPKKSRQRRRSGGKSLQLINLLPGYSKVKCHDCSTLCHTALVWLFTSLPYSTSLVVSLVSVSGFCSSLHDTYDEVFLMSLPHASLSQLRTPKLTLLRTNSLYHNISLHYIHIPDVFNGLIIFTRFYICTHKSYVPVAFYSMC